MLLAFGPRNFRVILERIEARGLLGPLPKTHAFYSDGSAIDA